MYWMCGVFLLISIVESHRRRRRQWMMSDAVCGLFVHAIATVVAYLLLVHTHRF